jgi:dethiobiotin synthetase
LTALFVTGTGTDVGKSFVTAGLIRELRRQGRRVQALKPVASGFDSSSLETSDAGVLLTALGIPPIFDNIAPICPWRFRAPLSPDMAARLEKRKVDFDALLTFCNEKIKTASDVLLIEGAGGIMSPLNEGRTMIDWMVALNLPVLLVTGCYLGAISHGLSAHDALTGRGLRVKCVVVNETEGCAAALTDTKATIQRFIRPDVVMALPRLPDAISEYPAFKYLAGII